MHTLYAQLRDQLRDRILQGQLVPHDKLPSESELSAEHGVSRITVRQALADLQRDGLIVRVQGKGAFVAAPRTQQSLQRLQGLGEALAGLGRVHSRRLSVKELRASPEAARALRLPGGSTAWQLASLRYLEREPLSVNIAWFPGALGERMLRIDASGRDYIDVLETELDRPVAQAELEISAVPAPTRQARLLKVEPGAPALRVQRVLHGADGQPLQFETALYRGDTFSYKLSLVR
ncbi:GntR family transcriptional regulator [Ramlibacter rhizophilus]|uniref:GntR family transcriptional regulator n=1 Tax=Ramlibacter rhizophilus TaxID=1781167 RepID=A0A4Z0BFE9_9BURK|nr:GntR family transcriptional regulator [Ramlibacter rhizophilus]TFY98032.1 GntR family transcriptional regulator [Ramlibacter rhizophilus]